MADMITLLGAGASVDAGIPTAAAMTTKISELLHREASLTGRSHTSTHFGCAFDVVAAALKCGPVGADIERIASAVQLIAQRHELEISPFISAWSPDIAAVETAHPGIYAALAEQLPRSVRSLILRSTGAVDYLHPLFGGSNTPKAIASLNYDLTIEQAARDVDATVDTGIGGWVRDAAWTWRSTATPLLKLHGSVDWSWIDDEVGPGDLPSRFIISDRFPREHSTPALVFGAREKLRAEGPFLSALAEFERLLGASDHLVIVGYSFRDDHVNQVIRRWTWPRRDELGRIRPRRITVLDPVFPSNDAVPPDFSGAFQRNLWEVARSGGSNTLKVDVCRQTAAVALPSIMSD